MKEIVDGSFFVTIEEKSDSKREISVFRDSVLSSPISRWVTSYPIELIEKILQVKGAKYLCDEIRRDEDDSYIRKSLEVEIFSYVKPEEFRKTRILDFGCGSGSSSLVLARMFPEAEIVGCELVKDFVEIARERVKFHGINGLSFFLSPDGNHLPENLGKFDFVVLNAVFEHLLPSERLQTLPILWDSLKENGILLISETPYRYSILESHTTGLPFLNFLPDKLAYQMAIRFSRRIDKNENWETLLRRGIRGGSEGEILKIIQPLNGNPVILKPKYLGISNRVELWHRLPSSKRFSRLKQILYLFYKVFWRLTGYVIVPQLSLAIKKTKKRVD